MTSQLLEQVIVPIATEEDAQKTCDALKVHVDADAQLHIVHVIEKGGGSPDKAPIGARQRQADEIFERVEKSLESAGYELETELRYGTSVIDEIVAAATESDGTAIAFVPREGGRITRLLTGDKTRDLVAIDQVPVIALPNEST
ncbi:universal stress protein [Halostagnicola sp. A-GB9-2]|uniref:universal stress protein n=1 Tax=Halostagnicola sp. A-GB9-2 TaxID=3048066 RepID=UPI0024C05E8A|nr:universal stress protein [Halostagnicola sp. A-GB9-2]MDJ1430921.1 universal stress protein [Halostagnicola sp. A-GB9-2]